MTERALSTVVNYAVTLVVVGLLVSGLLVGMNGHVAGQHERTIRSELAVVGNHLATDLTNADRLAETVESGGSATVRVALAERVADRRYVIDIAAAGPPDSYVLTLATDDPRVSVAVHVRTDRPVETGRFNGGDLVITTDGSSLEVAHE